MKKTFKHDGIDYTATLNKSGDPVVVTIADTNGDRVADLDYTQETRGDMIHENAADDEDIIDLLIETFRNRDMPAYERDDEEDE
jgi:hypothetical protein